MVELVFSVTDTGIGIPQEAIGRLFRSFARWMSRPRADSEAPAWDWRSAGGLAELIGGSMWVKSVEGKGSTFSFSIQAEFVPARPRPLLAGPKLHLNGRRMLIVDDNATNRRILATLAAGWTMVPRAAQSASEALGWLRAGEAFDVAVLDMQMPEMDGVMLAQGKSVNESTPVLVGLSGTAAARGLSGTESASQQDNMPSGGIISLTNGENRLNFFPARTDIASRSIRPLNAGWSASPTPHFPSEYFTESARPKGLRVSHFVTARERLAEFEQTQPSLTSDPISGKSHFAQRLRRMVDSNANLTAVSRAERPKMFSSSTR